MIAFIAECNENDAEEVGQIMTKYMLDSAQELVGNYVKFAVDVETGFSWGISINEGNAYLLSLWVEFVMKIRNAPST